MSSKRIRTGMQASAARAGRTAAVLLGMGFGAGLVWLVTTDSASSASGAGVGLGVGVGVGFGVALTVLAASAAFTAVSDTVRTVVGALLALLGASVPRPPAARIDLPATITQRRPDAPGRPQPRAPGLLRTIA
ncbi:DUF6412 domain-containing protein [Herbiconiux sp.]|uniref:DUF6412 domain-containing protein n=1 Tax=Herbiconiux sp. TaxID=1871186 RepID=UPI0025C635FB|nr:DUF6412 domain-containing protein [Herbiconiux sp.]